MFFVSGKKIGALKTEDGLVIEDIYEKLEITDDKRERKFVFTQNKEQGIQITIIPYNEELE